LRPVRLAQARQEPGVAGVIEESGMEAMNAARPQAFRSITTVRILS
jgi:hypothetical protein